MKFLYLTLSVLALSLCGQPPICRSQILYAWKTLEFTFPSKYSAEAAGYLNTTNAIPMDIQPYFAKNILLRIMVTVPRIQDGIPYTLATVSLKPSANISLLEPYPNYKAHDNNNNNNNKRDCDGITSAFRMAITECNQMWVIDSGVVGSEAQCPPQLLLFDLNTDKIIHRYRFSTSLYTAGASLFTNLLVDVKDPPPFGNCANATVYVADSKHHGLVVYDSMQRKAWRIEDLSMYPDPNYGIQCVAGESFFSMDGIYGMAKDQQYLYFHPLASATEYRVPLRLIDSSIPFKNKTYNFHTEFKRLGTRNSSCAASAIDSKNNLYCVTLNPIELLIWNTTTPYESGNIMKIGVETDKLEFVTSMKVFKSRRSKYEELWMMSNRYQKMAAGTLDVNDFNFYILTLLLKEDL